MREDARQKAGWIVRLVDLEPHWGQSVLMNHNGRGQSNFPPPGFRNAITFLCPHCRTQRLAVAFTPPIGPTDWLTPGQPVTEGQAVWTRASGDTFETLTLSPSIDTTERNRIDFAGHWHGHITAGEVK